MRLGLGTDISVGYRQSLFGGVPFLLDTYTGAAAAYSLRQLRTGVTNVVRVRRDTTPSAEQDFTAEEITDGTLLAFVGAGNNGYVVTWYDQSGNTGRDATQATAADQPKIVDAGVLVEENGKPAVLFSNNQDLRGTVSIGNGITSYTFCLWSPDSVINERIIAQVSGSIRRNMSITAGDFNIFDGTNVISASGTLSQTLQVGRYKTNDGELFINGSSVGTSATFIAQDVSDFCIGSEFGSNHVLGTCQEIIIYPSDQSSNRTAIEANINEHYNIYP